MERDELRTTLVNHLETLRRNLQIVSMEVLKTKYKKPFDALRQDICKAATAYTRFLVFDGMRIKHKYFDDDEMWDKAESQLREILTECFDDPPKTPEVYNDATACVWRDGTWQLLEDTSKGFLLFVQSKSKEEAAA